MCEETFFDMTPSSCSVHTRYVFLTWKLAKAVPFHIEVTKEESPLRAQAPKHSRFIDASVIILLARASCPYEVPHARSPPTSSVPPPQLQVPMLQSMSIPSYVLPISCLIQFDTGLKPIAYSHKNHAHANTVEYISRFIHLRETALELTY